MILVDRPELPPGHCIVNFSSEDPGGFVLLGERVVIDPTVYVSRQAVIDLGRLFGFTAPEDVEGLRESVRELASVVEDLQAELTDARRDLEAAEWTLERKFQAKPARKPGPRKVAA